MLAGKAEPPQETAWKKVNKISGMISNLDTIKFHTVATSFTRLQQTLNEENKYLTQLTEITQMAKVSMLLRKCQERLPTGSMGQLHNYVTLQTVTAIMGNNPSITAPLNKVALSA